MVWGRGVFWDSIGLFMGVTENVFADRSPSSILRMILWGVFQGLPQTVFFSLVPQSGSKADNSSILARTGLIQSELQRLFAMATNIARAFFGHVGDTFTRAEVAETYDFFAELKSSLVALSEAEEKLRQMMKDHQKKIFQGRPRAAPEAVDECLEPSHLPSWNPDAEAQSVSERKLNAAYKHHGALLQERRAAETQLATERRRTLEAYRKYIDYSKPFTNARKFFPFMFARSEIRTPLIKVLEKGQKTQSYVRWTEAMRDLPEPHIAGHFVVFRPNLEIERTPESIEDFLELGMDVQAIDKEDQRVATLNTYAEGFQYPTLLSKTDNKATVEWKSVQDLVLKPLSHARADMVSDVFRAMYRAGDKQAGSQEALAHPHFSSGARAAIGVWLEAMVEFLEQGIGHIGERLLRVNAGPMPPAEGAKKFHPFVEQSGLPPNYDLREKNGLQCDIQTGRLLAFAGLGPGDMPDADILKSVEYRG
eukprot:Gregarina_sp_Poly_1__1605@NODE_1406_length_4213_cov_32_136035_g936_i0_p2_GENE_NODE_1406_length_4213_cov_32_136035_g936_i0NODE_1406_length_4213_cov_32_136035_g936_i0_p2_ORF_typecomplete_len479_score81_76TehB/PF03848_14/1_8e03TehB/PF03848_14/0_023DUF3695/PF12494_8/0_26DegS/PF05384_11/0_28DegS/PF05384_11/5_8e03_NODE_1406_length_4213_cov_32_136035_g936_i011542590